MRKILLALTGLLAFIGVASAQTLPAGYLGTVTNNTPNTWQTFTYTFTPSTTGANFIGFAFRQDPAFWTFDNVSLTTSGSSTNLLTNGAFTSGGSINVTTTNGPSSIQAPTNWGVWYQNGTYPAAAGTWYDIGGTHGGVWYDGAVGTFDGIYQGIILQAGTTYTITFDVSGNNTSDGNAIQLGIYGGACASVSIAASQCTIPSSVGFTTLATPAEGAAAGNPTPTLVSDVPIASTSTSTITYGTSVVTTQVVDTSTNDRVRFTVNRTTTPITSTPWQNVTVTTPHTLQTYSDGSTITTDGTPTTTTTNGIIVQAGSSSTETQRASAVALRDAIAYRNFNPFIVDALSIKDGSWARPMIGYVRMENGRYRMKGMSFGYQKTIDNNTFGIAGSFQDTNSAGYLNSKSDNEAYAGTAYILTRQDYAWIKASVGVMDSNYTTNTTISSFNLSNSNKIKQRNTYADVTVYSPVDFAGFRPLFGATVVNSNLSSKEEWGSPLLSAIPNYKSKTEVRPYAGVRYEVGDGFSVEARGTQSKDFKNVVQVRGIYEKNVSEYVKVHVSAGVDKGSNMTGLVGMVGLTVRF